MKFMEATGCHICMHCRHHGKFVCLLMVMAFHENSKVEVDLINLLGGVWKCVAHVNFIYICNKFIHSFIPFGCRAWHQ